MRCCLSILFFLFCFFTKVFSEENPYQNQADKLFYAGNYEEAFRMYGSAIKADQPEMDNYKLYLNAGDCATMLNYNQMALSYYGMSLLRHASIEELEEHIRTYCNNTISCIPETLTKIAQKCPETQQSLYPEIAAILFKQAQYKESIHFLKECVIFKPDSCPILKMLADAFLNMGNMDSCFTWHQKIIEYYPDNYDSHSFVGNYYYVSAKKCLKQAYAENKKLKLAKGGEKTETDITLEYYYQMAAQYLEKAYNIYHSDEVKNSLIEIYTSIGDKDKMKSIAKNEKYKKY